MELYGFMEREKKIPSYFFIITKQGVNEACIICLHKEVFIEKSKCYRRIVFAEHYGAFILDVKDVVDSQKEY